MTASQGRRLDTLESVLGSPQSRKVIVVGDPSCLNFYSEEEKRGAVIIVTGVPRDGEEETGRRTKPGWRT